MSNPPLGCVHMVPGRGGMVSKLDLGDHYEQINVLMDDSSIYPCTKIKLHFVNTKGHCRVQVGSKIKFCTLIMILSVTSSDVFAAFYQI